ncbi:MAG: hypothetical protein II723_01155 [Oscillospiraceae bacterium]|nr:hypothetical protein [Oscillospiraceae bacterium]
MAHKRRDPEKRNAWRNEAAPGWVHVASGMTGSEPELRCFGVNLKSYAWENTGRCVQVRDPLHGEFHSFPVYAVVVNGRRREFAYGEYSMCIFGLYARK